MSFKDKVKKVNNQWVKANKSTGRPRIVFGDELPTPKMIPTGNPSLDWGLGGGIPESTIFELYGPPASSKTTSMSLIAAEVQKTSHPYVIWYLTEESVKPTKAWELANLDESKIIFVDARNHGEDGFNLIQAIIMENGVPSSEVGMLVIDSLAGLASAAEMNSVEEKGAEGATMGASARMLRKIFRVFSTIGITSEGLIIGIINQEVAQIGGTPMPNVTTGGSSVRYFPKIRIQLKVPNDGFLLEDDKGRTIGRQDHKKKVVGQTITFMVTKNNTGSSAPFTRGSWAIVYNKGIDVNGPIIAQALHYKVIQKLSAVTYVVRWLADGTQATTVKGRTAMEEYITATPGILDSLRDLNSKIQAMLAGDEVTVVDENIFVKDGQEIDLLEEVLKFENSSGNTSVDGGEFEVLPEGDVDDSVSALEPELAELRV